jgi:ATP-dependent Clp protease ATP-binding subunit ClpC
MSRPSLRIYVVRDRSGMLTGRLVARSVTRAEYVATGASEEELCGRLQEQLSAELDPQRAVQPFAWTEPLHVDKVLVEVRPQVTLGKRTVIGKQRIPLELSYAWAALASEERRGTPAGFRVMLPRFGFWFVLEDLHMAGEVLRQAVSATLAGEAARSLFEYREAAHEYVMEWAPRWRKPKAVNEHDDEELKVLRSVAEDWSELGRAGKLGSHFGPVDELRYAKLLTASQKPSLLLIGPSGVGKTEWVCELARRAGRPREGTSEVRVWSSSADRIMAGQSYLGMWEQRCLELLSELRGEGHFLFLDRLAELVRPRSGASSIADLLLPAIADGSISVLAECTVEEYERLQATHASLLACFEHVRVAPPSSEQVCALIAEHQQRTLPVVLLQPDAVRRLVHHLGLFRKSSAFPGKALVFLAWLAKAGPGVAPTGGPASAREVDRLFAKFSGLAERLVSDNERASAADISLAVQRRVVGQEAACHDAARVLARFKAGVNDPEKPLGSLLFVGPTGVGKTELAKELSRFLFGSGERLVRVDMSELMLAGSVVRLLSDERGSASLVQRVSQEPLSVVLLDEIEKAHPAVFDVLLGLLGEGRLTATSGRLVDFRMTLVIMTSNLGSAATRAGFGERTDDARSLHSAVRAHFRPEFFNRIDQIVTFSSLSPEALRRIVELSLEDLAGREGLRRRNLRVVVSDAAQAELARLGCDPEYGARPLKRVIEERIVMPLSVELSRRPATRDALARFDLVGSELQLVLEPAR